MVTKYAEKVKIYNHYTNYKGRLFVKTLCDLFNDAAEVQTELYKVDVDTLNAQGFTWMLHRLHILLHNILRGYVIERLQHYGRTFCCHGL